MAIAAPLGSYSTRGCSRSVNVKKPAPELLKSHSERDGIWDKQRSLAQSVGEAYEVEFPRLAERMAACSKTLLFERRIDPSTGEVTLKLRNARFCRVRHCPVCQWRRAMSWKAKFLQAIPDLVEQHPGARWQLLTLTVKNCEIGNLRATLSDMNDAWHRMLKRKEFRNVLGWIRTTEVTYGRGGTAHPHFHVLLMVTPSMAAGVNYVKQSAWVEAWQSAARLDYTPVVDIRGVKPKEMSWDEARAKGLDASALATVAAEVLKYAVKPSDMIEHKEWFLELTRQTHKLRFAATGGVLKGLLTTNVSKEEMLCADGSSSDESEPDASVPMAAYSWESAHRHYRRDRSRDAQAKPHRRGAPRERTPAGSG